MDPDEAEVPIPMFKKQKLAVRLGECGGRVDYCAGSQWAPGPEGPEVSAAAGWDDVGAQEGHPGGHSSDPSKSELNAYSQEVVTIFGKLISWMDYC